MTIEKYYTLREAVTQVLIGVDAYVLSRKCLHGEIPGAVKMGKLWLIPESTLKSILKVAA